MHVKHPQCSWSKSNHCLIINWPFITPTLLQIQHTHTLHLHIWLCKCRINEISTARIHAYSTLYVSDVWIRYANEAAQTVNKRYDDDIEEGDQVVWKSHPISPFTSLPASFNIEAFRYKGVVSLKQQHEKTLHIIHPIYIIQYNVICCYNTKQSGVLIYFINHEILHILFTLFPPLYSLCNSIIKGALHFLYKCE